MKKAFLVTFNVTTRVIADVPEDFDAGNCNTVIPEHMNAMDAIVAAARENILEEPEMYLYRENAEIERDEIEDTEEDWEC